MRRPFILPAQARQGRNSSSEPWGRPMPHGTFKKNVSKCKTIPRGFPALFFMVWCLTLQPGFLWYGQAKGVLDGQYHIRPSIGPEGNQYPVKGVR